MDWSYRSNQMPQTRAQAPKLEKIGGSFVDVPSSMLEPKLIFSNAIKDVTAF